MNKYNFNIDIDITDSNDNLQKKKFDQLSQIQSYNKSIFVDLGLPSGTLWARYNLGVNPNKLNEYTAWFGNFYSWGDLNPNKLDFTKTAYEKWSNTDYYNAPNFHGDYPSNLRRKEDAAYVESNGIMKMPNKKNAKELIENVTCKLQRNFMDIEQLGMYILTSKINGEKLYIPVTPRYVHTFDKNDEPTLKKFSQGEINGYSDGVGLWTNELVFDEKFERIGYADRAYIILIQKLDRLNVHTHEMEIKDNLRVAKNFRYVGCPIRPIKVKQ